MGDFRKQAKENPLKPDRVFIPQFDPLTEISHPQAKPEPELKASTPITMTVAPQEPLTQAGDIASYKSKYLHKDEDKVTKTFRMYKWRSQQLEQETRDTGLDPWQIIDIGLEMYFRDKHNEQEAEASAS